MTKKKQAPVQEMPTEWRQILLEERPDGTLEPKAIHPVAMEAPVPPPPPSKPKAGMKPALRKPEEGFDEWQDILQQASSGQGRQGGAGGAVALSLHPDSLEANERTIKGVRLTEMSQGKASVQEVNATIKTTPVQSPPASPSAEFRPEQAPSAAGAGADAYPTYSYQAETSYGGPSIGSQTELPGVVAKPIRQALVIPMAQTDHAEPLYAKPFPLQKEHPPAEEPTDAERTHDIQPEDARLQEDPSHELSGETREAGATAFASSNATTDGDRDYSNEFHDASLDLSTYTEKPYLPPPDATRIGPPPWAPSPSASLEGSGLRKMPSGPSEGTSVTRMSTPPAAPAALSGSFSVRDIAPAGADLVQVYDLLVQQQKQMQRHLEQVTEALKLQHEAFLIQTHALQAFQGQMATVGTVIETSQDAGGYRFLYPLLQDLLMLFDYVDLRFRSLWEHGERHPAVQEVAAIRKRLLDTLAQHDVEPIELTSYQFDPSAHRALQEVPSMHPEEDFQISRIFRQGFLYKKALFRPIEVEIKRYTPS